MADQEAHEDARRAAEALLLRAEQRLSSPTAAASSTSSAGNTNAGTSNSLPPTAAAAAAAAQAQASIKSALIKAQGSIKSAQDKVSASIETIERTAAEKIEGITSSAVAEKPKTNANAAAAEEGGASGIANPSTASTTDGAASVKAALGRAQGSIRSFQEKVSTSLDAVKAQTQASLSVVKHIDSSTSEVNGKSEAGDTVTGSNGGEKMERLKSESTAMVQGASKSMKSALGKMTASVQGLKLESLMQHSTGATSAPSQEDIEAKIYSDLDRVSEQIELCRSMMSQGNDGGGENSSESSLFIVVGYLEASTARFASLINAGTAGEISEEALERVLSVNHELRRTLDDYSKTMPSDSTTPADNKFSGEGCVSEDKSTAASAPPSDSNVISDYSDDAAATVADVSKDGGGSPVESSEMPGMELGNTTDL